MFAHNRYPTHQAASVAAIEVDATDVPIHRYRLMLLGSSLPIGAATHLFSSLIAKQAHTVRPRRRYPVTVIAVAVIRH